MKIGDRLKMERQRLGVSPAEFAVLCGVSRTSQFAYESGARLPDADYLAKANDAGVDLGFVVTGKGKNAGDDFVVIQRHDVVASAGPGALNEDGAATSGLCFSRKWLSKRGLNPKNLLVVDVGGKSMYPLLDDGDTVLVDKSETTPRSGFAYVLRQGAELLVKYAQLLPEGLLRLTSENNQSYPPYDIDLSKTTDVSILGRVVASTHEW